MKKINIISMFIFVLFLVSCDKDDKVDNKIDLKFPDLKYTVWEGTKNHVYFDDTKVTDDVYILFLSESRGNSIVSGKTSSQQRDFEYVINDRLLTIEGQTVNFTNHFLNGDWLLTEMGVNRMVLVKDLHNRRDKYILELRKNNSVDNQ